MQYGTLPPRPTGIAKVRGFFEYFRDPLGLITRLAASMATLCSWVYQG